MHNAAKLKSMIHFRIKNWMNAVTCASLTLWRYSSCLLMICRTRPGLICLSKYESWSQWIQERWRRRHSRLLSKGFSVCTNKGSGLRALVCWPWSKTASWFRCRLQEDTQKTPAHYRSFVCITQCTLGKSDSESFEASELKVSLSNEAQWHLYQ